jgi:hypothetical protein
MAWSEGKMGAIVNELQQVLTKHVQEHGLVNWFDPDEHYKSALRDIQISGCQIIAYDGSYFALRAAAEPFIRSEDPPKLLVYLPISFEDAEVPLSELLALGQVLRPGAIGLKNTKLGVIARRALKGIVADARLTDLDRQVEKGQLSLRDLEALATGGTPETLSTVLTVLFGVQLAEDAALDFLVNTSRDLELVSKNATGDWVRVLKASFDVPVTAEQSIDQMRAALARQVLVADLLESLGENTPNALKNLASPKEANIRKRCVDVARAWRNRRDFGLNYERVAETLENNLRLESVEFTDDSLRQVRTFASLERRLLRSVARRIVEAPDLDVEETIGERRNGFWAEQYPDIQMEWGLLSNAIGLMKLAKTIETNLRLPHSTPELISEYTQGPNPWCEFDSLQRRLEKRASSLEFVLNNPPEEIETLIVRARQRYSAVANLFAELFVRTWSAEGFQITGYYRQSQIFETFVAPLCREYKTAYILVDALRFELARELPALLGKEFEQRLECVIGTVPSVTEVGMAALLPGASAGLRLSGTNKFEVSIHGSPLRNRQDRIEYLSKTADAQIVDLKLEDPATFRRKVKEISSERTLIVVTSREIDQIGEDQFTWTREHMERVLSQICLAIRRLADCGVERFVIAADHGHLFAAELSESEKIEPPSGKAILLHRRVWLGRGGEMSESYLYTKLENTGIPSDLELATPWNLAGFKTAGPTAYFHGGASPQEILLPVLTLIPKGWTEEKGSKKMSWEIALGTPKITTRFLSVRVSGRSQILFETGWPLIRVEVRAGNEVCSTPVSSTYGYQEVTGEATMRASESDPTVAEANTVALMLTGKAPNTGIVSVHLFDASSGMELKRIEKLEVSIVI